MGGPHKVEARANDDEGLGPVASPGPERAPSCLRPFEYIDKCPRRLRAPGVDDELLELGDPDPGQPHQDRRKPVVVWLGEERLLVGGEPPAAMAGRVVVAGGTMRSEERGA